MSIGGESTRVTAVEDMDFDTGIPIMALNGPVHRIVMSNDG